MIRARGEVWSDHLCLSAGALHRPRGFGMATPCLAEVELQFLRKLGSQDLARGSSAQSRPGTGLASHAPHLLGGAEAPSSPYNGVSTGTRSAAWRKPSTALPTSA